MGMKSRIRPQAGSELEKRPLARTPVYQRARDQIHAAHRPNVACQRVETAQVADLTQALGQLRVHAAANDVRRAVQRGEGSSGQVPHRENVGAGQGRLLLGTAAEVGQGQALFGEERLKTGQRVVVALVGQDDRDGAGDGLQGGQQGAAGVGVVSSGALPGLVSVNTVSDIAGRLEIQVRLTGGEAQAQHHQGQSLQASLSSAASKRRTRPGAPRMSSSAVIRMR